MFPACVDVAQFEAIRGTDDFSSHVSYPENGDCPNAGDTKIPELHMNIDYELESSDLSGFRLVSDMYDRDMPGGFSAHGDFLSGWDPTSLAGGDGAPEGFVECLNRLGEC